jgi:hypothetical protein
LNAEITSRTVCSFAANITAISRAALPCNDANTMPARRNRTRSFAVRDILTRRCASSGSNSRTNTSGLRAITDHLPHPASDTDLLSKPTRRLRPHIN